MPTEEQMTVNERRKYLKLMKVRYVAAKRVERSQLLTERQEVTSLHRKSLTRLMHTASLERTKRQKPRPRTYGSEIERVVVRVWESRDYICAERLTPSLLRMAQHLARFEPLGLTAQVEGQLATISRATVARILGKYRSRMRRLPQKGAERANQVTKGVPMGRIPWDISDPGHFEVDLVHHNGESSAGLYGHTIQLVDVATGWRERVAALNALYEQMWLYYNLFQPVLHLCEKTVVDGKVHRKWDQAKTPYERLLTSKMLGPEQQVRLQHLYEQTNPLALRQEIYQHLTGLWDMPSAESGAAA